MYRKLLLYIAFAATTACAANDTPTDGVTIEYIAHASFRIHSDEGTTVLIDPFASKVWIGYDFPPAAVRDVDAVMITHPHYDHDGGQFRDMPVPWSDRTRVLDSAGTYTVKDIAVTGIRGKHADPYGNEFGQRNTVWLMTVDGLRIAHLGDNGPLTPQNIAALGRVDVLMMPIDGEYHILSEIEIQNILMELRPSFLIPMHYRHPDLEEDDEPEGLGPIEPWVSDKFGVIDLESNVWIVNVADIPDEPQIIVFQHSPDVRR